MRFKFGSLKAWKRLSRNVYRSKYNPLIYQTNRLDGLLYLSTENWMRHLD
jgi:hypothetical protein